MSSPKPAVLIVIDGWGVRDEEYGNAIMKADTPVGRPPAARPPAEYHLQ